MMPHAVRAIPANDFKREAICDMKKAFRGALQRRQGQSWAVRFDSVCAALVSLLTLRFYVGSLGGGCFSRC